MNAMSLFDDDFYSTRVSTRTKWKQRDWVNFKPSKSWTSLRIALVSSFVSSIAAVLIFSLITGIGGGSPGPGTSLPAGTNIVQSVDSGELIIQVSAKVGPAVVSIVNEQALGALSFGDSFGDLDTIEPEEEVALQQASLGSGVLYEQVGKKARIITNYHVIDQADAIKVVLSNGEAREATIVGKDQISDIAVLEIEAKGNETYAEIGDSSKLRWGETILAIGNPLGLDGSLTRGIVSRLNGIIPVSLNQDGVYDWEQEVIQIDASINSGNSGGALVDLNGRVVGINSMKIADYGVEGIGFAIPMNNVMPIVTSLVEHGRVLRPYLGVYTLDLEEYNSRRAFTRQFNRQNSAEGEESESEAVEEEDNGLGLPADVKRGVLVMDTVGPALRGGLQINDVIVQLDKQQVGSTMELRKYLYTKKKIGENIEVVFYRAGELQKLTLTLGESGSEGEE